MDLDFTTVLVHITTCTYVLSDRKAWHVAHSYLRYLMPCVCDIDEFDKKASVFDSFLAEEHWTLNDFSATGTFLSRFVSGF